MIRPAQSDDIPSFTALQRRVADDDTIWGYGADSEAAWTARDLAWSFVAGEQQPVGFVYCAPREHAGECAFPPGSKILEIVELLVHPDHRSRGYGRQLVTAVHDLARRDGFSHLRVYSAARRFDDVVRFYRRCGFAPWYVEMIQPLRADQSRSQT